jgi:hypothetical protein
MQVHFPPTVQLRRQRGSPPSEQGGWFRVSEVPAPFFGFARNPHLPRARSCQRSGRGEGPLAPSVKDYATWSRKQVRERLHKAGWPLAEVSDRIV